MAITEDINGKLVEGPFSDQDQFQRCGVIRDDVFAIVDERDRLKQIQFKTEGLPTNTQVVLQGNPSSTGVVTITLPATSGTLTTSSGSLPLTQNHIFVGDASNLPADVALSGDASIISTGALTVTSVGASSAANIHSAELLANAATSSNTASAIVKRDASGNFSAGSPTFSGTVNANSGIDRSSAGTLSFGTLNASTINIGNSGATVNIQGTTLYENVSQLQVTDPLITLNKSGGIGSAANSGIELEENSVITAYVETSADRNSWLLKAPNTAGEATITPGSSGITLNQSSHNPVTLGTANGLSLATQALSLQAADATHTGALTSTDWSTFNSKQSSLTFSSPLVNSSGTVSINGTVADDKLSFGATGDLTKKLSVSLSGQTTGVTTTLAPLSTQNETINIQPLVDATGNLIVQNGTSGQVFIGSNATIGGANSGIQYSDASTANRGQIKLHSYFNGTSVAGVSTLTSRSGTVGVNNAVVAGQDYSKWTAQAGASTVGSAPISGSFAFKANTVNSLTVTSDYHVQLTNLAGTLGDRFVLSSEGIPQFNGLTAGVIKSDSSGVLSSNATGDLTDAGTDGIVITGGTGAVIGSGTSIAQHVADASHNGYLSSTDWSTFNNKQAAGNYITALTSDVSASGPGSASATVNFVGTSSATDIHSAELLANASTSLNTASAIVKRDANKNFLANQIIESISSTTTSGGTTTLTISSSPNQRFVGSSAQTAVLPDATTLSNGHRFAVLNRATASITVKDNGNNTLNTVIAGDEIYLVLASNATSNGTWDISLDDSSSSGITALTGDATATGPGSAALTLATVNGNVGSFGSSTAIPSFTVNAKGLMTAASTNAVVAPAGTLSGTTLNATVVSSSLTSVGTISSGTWNGTSINPTYGGTGVSNPTAHTIPVAEGSSNFTFISPSTAGFVLTSNGTGSDPSFQAVSSGGTITSWAVDTGFTPSGGFGTVTNKSIFKRRVGDTMEVRGRWTSGTVSGTTASLAIPNTLTIDTTKLNATNNNFMGSWYSVRNGTITPTTAGTGPTFADGSSTTDVFFGYETNSTAIIKEGGSTLSPSNVDFVFWFTIPITEWA